MVEQLRFDGKVAIVTGAGGGLGRSHALLLASRGAQVVVNDLGGSVDGEGAETQAADAVVAQIKEAGGNAVANYASVTDVDAANALVQQALDTFGRVDIIINNAGILRDVSFHKMEKSQWDAVIDVHLTGTMNVTKAAWPHLREQGYGRILNTTSAAGLYGNFGQANYSAAKMGLVGFTKTLAVEGGRKGIRSNCIAPIAKSRMTETIGLPAKVLEALEPERVSPLVAYLVHESCEPNGETYAVGGGYMSRIQVLEGKGVDLGSSISPEDVVENFSKINDMSNGSAFPDCMTAIKKALEIATS